jgi:hypothetical protein
MKTAEIIKLQKASADMWELVMKQVETKESLEQYRQKMVGIAEVKNLESEIYKTDDMIKQTMRSYKFIIDKISELCR